MADTPIYTKIFIQLKLIPSYWYDLLLFFTIYPNPSKPAKPSQTQPNPVKSIQTQPNSAKPIQTQSESIQTYPNPPKKLMYRLTGCVICIFVIFLLFYCDFFTATPFLYFFRFFNEPFSPFYLEFTDSSNFDYKNILRRIFSTILFNNERNQVKFHFCLRTFFYQ